MKLDTCRQLSIKDISDANIDVIICASGYESRCVLLAQELKHLNVKKYALAFNTHIENPKRLKNNKIFDNLGYRLIPTIDDDYKEIKELLKEISSSIEKDSVTILIDYSSMTRVWYAYFLLYFSQLRKRYKTANILFSYSYSKFLPSVKNETLNKNVGPIYGFFNLTIPDKPTALVIGLGYEKIRSFGLTEYLDAETFLFYTDSEKDNADFTNEVEIQNLEILSTMRKSNIYKYPISNLEVSLNLLYTLCSDLKDDYRIVLAPCGPKPFTLISLVTSLKLGYIDVWRVSSGSESNIYDRQGNGKVSILNCTFKD